MRHKNVTIKTFVFLKKLLDVAIVASLLFSCSVKQSMQTSEMIVGKWEMVNLDELNTRLKIHNEESEFKSANPFDPIRKLIMIYNIDGTGHWEVEYQDKVQFQHNFIYQFVTQDEFEFVREGDEAVYMHRIQAADVNSFTDLLIGVSIDGKKVENRVDVSNAIPQTFRRLN